MSAPTGQPAGPEMSQVDSKNVVDAKAAAKPLPPEPTESINTRRAIVLTFWMIVLCLGFPMWWATTMIYRAPLPLSHMRDWSEGKICRPNFPLRVELNAPSLSDQEAQHLLRTTQHALDDRSDFSAHHLRLVPSEAGITAHGNSSYLHPVKDDIALTINLHKIESGATPRTELHPYLPILSIFHTSSQIPSSSSTVSPLASFIASELQTAYKEEQASLAYLLGNTPWAPTNTKQLSWEEVDRLSRRQTRSFKYAPTYHLTFSLFTPTALPSNWDIEAALKEYISPLLTSLSSVSNFTVDTQVQLYATFSPSMAPPVFDEGRQAWILQRGALSGFINAAEWPLSPSIGEGPTMNFILYVPDSKQTPLVIEDNESTNWLIPQWGGVQILNLAQDASRTAALTKADLAPAMQTFSKQLLALLGLPETPASLPLRISTLTRVHVASLIYSASSTLGALNRLTETLPSISIPDSVRNSVESTIYHLDQACSNLRLGRFHKALESARTAEAQAERAFFEKSMVGQVYFPDEHKVAVYLPLLGPIAVPLIMAAIKEIKGFTAKGANV